MNDKIRFIVLTLLMIVLFPFTIIMIAIAWLIGELETEYRQYVHFYRKTWS